MQSSAMMERKILIVRYDIRRYMITKDNRSNSEPKMREREEQSF
jgi:hypothetical protein|tara:strand:+ start:306 stop:437 length:132 start_codon:yes stop_codon:yes gene_type:complete